MSDYLPPLSVLVQVDGTSANSEAEIISTQDEILTYVNHTAKLACIIQNKNRHHVSRCAPVLPGKQLPSPFQVTWSRVTFINETQKLTSLLFVDLLKYSPFSRYHLTHVIERDNREYWNLEIRNIHLSDQGYYSCVLTAIKPISKIFHVKVLGMYHASKDHHNRQLMMMMMIVVSDSREVFTQAFLEGGFSPLS